MSIKVHTVDCVVFEGLCNRINSLVSALTVQDELNLYWAINKHCPVACSDLFNVPLSWRVFELKAGTFPYSRSIDRINWFFLCNPASLEREQFVATAKSNYRKLIGLLKHRPSFSLPDGAIGISYRFHLPRSNQEGFDQFIRRAEELVEEMNPSAIFVASDHADSKKAISCHFENAGMLVRTVDCELMNSDLDRSKGNLAGLSKDLVLFAQCTGGIVANTERSTVPDSARGFGISVFRPPRQGKYRKRSTELEGWIDESNLRRN